VFFKARDLGAAVGYVGDKISHEVVARPGVGTTLKLLVQHVDQTTAKGCAVVDVAGGTIGSDENACIHTPAYAIAPNNAPRRLNFDAHEIVVEGTLPVPLKIATPPCSPATSQLLLMMLFFTWLLSEELEISTPIRTWLETSFERMRL
jgi:hypothetical protein